MRTVGAVAKNPFGDGRRVHATGFGALDGAQELDDGIWIGHEDLGISATASTGLSAIIRP